MPFKYFLKYKPKKIKKTSQMQCKITLNTNNQENLNLRRHSTDTNNEIIEILETFSKDFKSSSLILSQQAIITCQKPARMKASGQCCGTAS